MNVLDGTPRLLRNDGGNRRNWLMVVPLQEDTGMVALGGTVTVRANALTMIQPVLGVNGYLTSSDPRPHFGLGNATQAESIEILWPDGKKRVLKNVPANQVLKVKPGDAP
jgi:enediyne biosynthesis protein E4